MVTFMEISLPLSVVPGKLRAETAGAVAQLMVLYQKRAVGCQRMMAPFKERKQWTR